MATRLLRQRWWAVVVGTAASVIVATGAGPTAAQAASGPTIPKTYLSALTPQQIQSLSQNENQKVIVLLKDQHPEAAAPGSGRSALLAADQSPITHELSQLHAPGIHANSFVNAVSATVSTAEVSRLEQDPAVLAVVPDTQVEASPSTPQLVAVPSDTSVTAGADSSSSASSTTEGSGTPAQACPSNPSKPLLEPEALQSLDVDFGPGGPPAAHSLANGAGVKVAVFPDGLDPNIPDFQRGGTSAIFDYEDFSGEGTGGVTGGEEAFGDASSIISQGNEVFDLSGEVNPAYPLPAGCNIKIEGVAPGASLAVMKVFGDTNFAFNSEILQGIDWAVNVDHVNILSESFGENPVPNPGTDPIAVADQDAVNAGITVVVSSGDAGSTNTIATPSLDPGVISAGATTDYRLYQQTTSYGIQLDGSGGWLSDQISGLSSSGITEGDQTIDVLAPGEAGWADCSTNTAVFTECADIYNGTAPQPIVAFGGTSESAPLTAGVAALVIQAYREKHGGVTPSPAVVKQILMSTARDLDTRADDQGAGLLDAYRAVQAALSYQLPTKTGNALLYSTNSISSVATPNTSSTTIETVTNDGKIAQTVSPSVRALGPASTIARGTLALDQATDPTFVYQTGQIVGDLHYVKFKVPAGTDRLAASIAWQQSLAANPDFQTVRFDLFNPEGQLVLQSRPQGPVGSAGGGFSQDEVHDAQPGMWELVTFDTAFAGPDQYTGPLTYSITSQSFQTVHGAVSPASAVILPGASANFAVTVTTPATPGDTSESLVFGPAPGGDPARATVAITLRSLARVGKTFSATMTGGNSRMSFYGQELPYQFDVRPGQSDIEANVTIDNPGYQVLAFLVDPAGTLDDVQSSAQWNGSGAQGQTISLFWQDPAPGRWSLDVVQVNDVESVLTSTRFTVSLADNQVQARAHQLPDKAKTVIPQGSSDTATIKVTNTGEQQEAFMVDARRDQQTILPLTALFASPANEPLPITNGGLIPQFLVPPYSPEMEMAATSTVPITLDTSPDFGTPDVEAFSFGDAAIALATADDLPASIWSCAPSEQGPFATTAPNTTYSCGALAVTDAFAGDVSTSAGNLWGDLELGTSTYDPLVLNPGQSGTISVTITPTDPVGTQVSGFLSLETFNFNTLSSDQLVSFPYAYTVGA
ncbi:MAG: S8 family serine peptidase [Candidatus Dormiibacterota bacterium]